MSLFREGCFSLILKDSITARVSKSFALLIIFVFSLRVFICSYLSSTGSFLSYWKMPSLCAHPWPWVKCLITALPLWCSVEYLVFSHFDVVFRTSRAWIFINYHRIFPIFEGSWKLFLVHMIIFSESMSTMEVKGRLRGCHHFQFHLSSLGCIDRTIHDGNPLYEANVLTFHSLIFLHYIFFLHV